MDLLQRTSRRYRRWGMGLLGLSLALLSVWGIQAAEEGLEVTPLPSTTPPLTIVAPAGAAEEPRPLVLVGHGSREVRIYTNTTFRLKVEKLGGGFVYASFTVYVS